MADAHDAADAPGGGGGAPPEPPFTFLDMPCDLISCLGPVASTSGYAEEMDGLQCLCRAARDDTMLGAATANLRYGDEEDDPRSRLQYACSMNNEARVAWLLECGALDVLAATHYRYTGGGAALVRRLAFHPLVDATEALVAAAYVGVAELVAPLLARGALLEQAVRCMYRGVTALQAASYRGHLEVVRALLAAGSAVDAVDSYGCTALMLTASGDSLEVVQALVAAGADVNRRDNIYRGRSAAARATAPNAEAVAAYLCALPQADPSAHIAAASWLGNVERVRDFIARGADVEERDFFGATCLMTAAHRGHVEVVRTLVDADANVTAASRGVSRMSVLSYGVGQPAVLAALLERYEVGGHAWRQAALNRALFLAVSYTAPQFVECVRLLLGAGAQAGAHVADLSATEGSLLILVTSQSWPWLGRPPAGGRISMLSAAARVGNAAAFRLLLDAGADMAGMDRERSPKEEVRRHCIVPEAVPALLAALADAAAGGGGVAAAGAGGGGGGAAAAQ
jgi:ankyrin repeat protein